MIRALLLALTLILAGPLAAQTATDDSDAGTDGADDSAASQTPAASDDSALSGEAETEGQLSQEAVSVDDGATASNGAETGRPVPASPEGIKGLENPDAAAFSEGREDNRNLLADRQAPASYPTLETPDDDGGALDGAETAQTLATKEEGADTRALFTALAAMNCRIAPDEVATRLGPLGFEPQMVTSTLGTLYVEGVASQDSQGYLTLPAALCPPDNPAPSPRDQVLAALRDNGCSVSEDQLRAAPGVSDLSEPQLLAVLGPMRDKGEIETDARTATLSPELCQAQ